MRWLFLVVVMFGFFAWDIASNDGRYTNEIRDTIEDLGRQLGI
jgi:hypothetical protein